MQLLERNDRLKWVVWTASGKQQEGEVQDDEYDAEDFKIDFFEYYNIADA